MTNNISGRRYIVYTKNVGTYLGRNSKNLLSCAKQLEKSLKHYPKQYGP